jgi:hypothetical protein
LEQARRYMMAGSKTLLLHSKWCTISNIIILMCYLSACISIYFCTLVGVKTLGSYFIFPFLIKWWWGSYPYQIRSNICMCLFVSCMRFSSCSDDECLYVDVILWDVFFSPIWVLALLCNDYCHYHPILWLLYIY